MKKFLLITAGICALLGIVLLGIGTATGGWKTAVRWAVNGDLQIIDGVGFNFGWGDKHFDHDYEIYDGDGSDTIKADISTIKKISVSAGGSDFKIKQSKDNNIQIEYENSDGIQYYVSDGTLYITEESYVFMSGDSRTYLYLPENCSFESVNLDIGAGKLTGSNIKADKISIDVGAGQIILNKLVTDDLNCELGAGQITLEDCSIRDGKMDVGMGAINYTGSISGNLDVDCSMGSTNLNLSGSLNDHNYDLECSMGEIQIGSHEYSGMDKEKTINNGADSNFVLECSMGNIEIEFNF